MKSLSLRDQNTLATWLRTGMNLADVERIERHGLVGNARFSERTRDWFKFLWTWAAPRFSGAAAKKHDRAYKRLGKLGYDRRIARVQELVKKLGGA